MVNPDVSASVSFQTRVPRDLALEVTQAMLVLGIDGRSEAVRQGLRLLTKEARHQALQAEMEEFYGDTKAPLSPVTRLLTDAG